MWNLLSKNDYEYSPSEARAFLTKKVPSREPSFVSSVFAPLDEGSGTSDPGKFRFEVRTDFRPPVEVRMPSFQMHEQTNSLAFYFRSFVLFLKSIKINYWSLNGTLKSRSFRLPRAIRNDDLRHEIARATTRYWTCATQTVDHQFPRARISCAFVTIWAVQLGMLMFQVIVRSL